MDGAGSFASAPQVSSRTKPATPVLGWWSAKKGGKGWVGHAKITSFGSVALGRKVPADDAGKNDRIPDHVPERFPH